MHRPLACGAAACTVALLGLFAPGLSRAAGWQENITMLVQVDGKPDGTAHVYDSGDYQSMLVVIDDRATAVVLGLGDDTVDSVPRDSIRVGGDGTADFGQAATSFLTSLDRKDGIMSFQIGDDPVTISPLPPLIGPATLDRILALKPSYAVAAKAYRPDPSQVAALKAVAADTEIRVYFGTWCFMCKKLLPCLIRTLDEAGNPKIQVHYIGVDEDVKQPEANIQRDHVTTTPTIIVMQGGRELDRIEEKASTTIEGDLARILTRKG